MKNVSVATTKSEREFRAIGELNYVHDYEKFPGLNKDGYFLALTYALPSSLSAPEDAVVVSSHGARIQKSPIPSLQRTTAPIPGSSM